MRILFVTDAFPFPSNRNGNTENISNILVRLTDFKVDLLYIGDTDKLAKENIRQLEKITNKIYFINLKSRKLLRIVSLFYRINFGLTEDYDILFFSTFLSGYARFNFNLKSYYILYQADSRSLFYSRLKGIKNRIKYLKFRIEQKYLIKRFDKTIFVSEFDEAEVNHYLGFKNKTLTIPIGCNLVSRDYVIENKDIDLIFTGNFHFPPNSSAAIYFIINILPELLIDFPKIKVFFVGRNPTSSMKLLGEKYSRNLIITGEVKDINLYLGRAKVYISPLYMGSGMKNKILQAMSNSLSVIASAESTAGFIDKKNFLIADNASDWIKHINYLLNSDDEREMIGLLNLKIVTEKYNFDYIVKHYYVPFFKGVYSGSSVK
jgi:glycosyltransferase involved in cell wall biosynthesis